MLRRLLPVLLSAAMALPAFAVAEEGERALPELGGRWAQLQVTTLQIEVPVLGEVVTTTKALLLFDLRQERERLHWKETVCQIDVDDGTPLVKTVLPPAFARAVSGVRRSARIIRDEAGYRLHQAKQFVVQGARLGDVRGEPLPTGVDDERLSDGDEDGKPGLTVVVKGIVSGEMYVVQRDWTSLSGPIAASGFLDGLITWGLERHILAATDSALSRITRIQPHPDSRLSYFRSTRVAAGTGCEELLAQRDTLFER
jgi:hypothetical protein